MPNQNVYILQSEDREFLAVRSSLKKIAEEYEGKLFSYKYLSQMLGESKKKTGKKDITFTGRDGNTYRLSVHQIR